MIPAPQEAFDGNPTKLCAQTAKDLRFNISDWREIDMAAFTREDNGCPGLIKHDRCDPGTCSWPDGNHRFVRHSFAAADRFEIIRCQRWQRSCLQQSR